MAHRVLLREYTIGRGSSAASDRNTGYEHDKFGAAVMAVFEEAGFFEQAQVAGLGAQASGVFRPTLYSTVSTGDINGLDQGQVPWNMPFRGTAHKRLLSTAGKVNLFNDMSRVRGATKGDAVKPDPSTNDAAATAFMTSIGGETIGNLGMLLDYWGQRLLQDYDSMVAALLDAETPPAMLAGIQEQIDDAEMHYRIISKSLTSWHENPPNTTEGKAEVAVSKVALDEKAKQIDASLAKIKTAQLNAIKASDNRTKQQRAAIGDSSSVQFDTLWSYRMVGQADADTDFSHSSQTPPQYLNIAVPETLSAAQLTSAFTPQVKADV